MADASRSASSVRRKQFAGTEEVFLSDKLVERFGPHAGGQGLRPFEVIGFLAAEQ